MTTHFSGLPLPAESSLDINIHVTQPLNITSFSARQQVTQYVMNELSTQLGGDTPELTIAERIYWSVPVICAARRRLPVLRGRLPFGPP